MRIIVTGDFCLCGRVEQLVLNGNHDHLYGDLLDALTDKDISITNLECPLIIDPDPIDKSGPHLSANPACVKAIQYGQFDIVTLANNHIMDHGQKGLESTLQACKDVNVKTVGAGTDLESSAKPLLITERNGTIAILNFAEHEFSTATATSGGANPLDTVGNYYQIKYAKENADIVLVIVHGGHEHFPLPSPRMMRTYRYFVDLGASAVIGHHSHCPSGYEIYHGAPIFYSLGNFIFEAEQKDDDWHRGYFVKLDIEASGVRDMQLFPYEQCKDQVGLRSMAHDQEECFLKHINRLCSIIADERKVSQEWERMVDMRTRYFLSALYSLGRGARFLLKNRWLAKLVFLRKSLRKTSLLRLLNLVQCEAHRDVVVRIMRNMVGKR
ncbi:MAG: capsular biosynthesis protein [Planctomycetes bacterium B3_Pla]|nr:MAG: capsular biosynthesis protein [Planctomycetes bacterium B3_Pla]